MIHLDREQYQALINYWKAKQAYQEAFMLETPFQRELLERMKTAKIRLVILDVIRRHGDDPPEMREAVLDSER